MQVARHWLAAVGLVSLGTTAMMVPFAACDGTTSGPGGGANSGGSSGVSGTGGTFSWSCPATPPVSGSPCTPPPPPDAGVFSGHVADCSWGDDPRPTCRTTALCTDGNWQITVPKCSTP